MGASASRDETGQPPREVSRKGSSFIASVGSKASTPKQVPITQPSPASPIATVPLRPLPRGIKLSWLLTQLHTPSDGDRNANSVVEGAMLSLEDLNAEGALGCASHVVLVHPSMPWLEFASAVCDYVRLDVKRVLRTGEEYLSARLPRVSSSPTSPASSQPLPIIQPLPIPDAVGKATDPGTWLGVGQGGPCLPCDQTFLCFSFCESTAPSCGSGTDHMADAAARALAAMPQPAALVVLDTAGALFMDPRTVRALATAVAALRDSPRSAPTAGASPPGGAAAADSDASGFPGRLPLLQLASCLLTSDSGPLTTAFSRLPAVLCNDLAAASAVQDAVLQAAHRHFQQYSALLGAYTESRMSFTLEPERSLFGGGGLHTLSQTTAPDQFSLLLGQTSSGHGAASDSRFGGGSVTEGGAVTPVAPTAEHYDPRDALDRELRTRSLITAPTAGDQGPPAVQQRFLSMHYYSRTLTTATAPIGAGALAAAASCHAPDAAAAPAAGCGGEHEPVGSLTPLGVDAAAIALAGGSASSSPFAMLPPDNTLVPFAVEAARRYAALLEAVGRLAPAAAVLEACIAAAAERWGQRSKAVGTVRTQLGRLQQRQGLHRAAELTWRQVIEALERCHGPNSPAVLTARVAVATSQAALRDSTAEDSMRSALSALDAACGPAAPETLAARRAVAQFLAENRRWAEAEVAYQALLEAQEKAPPPQPSPTLATAPAVVAGEPVPAVPAVPAVSAVPGNVREGPLRMASRQRVVPVAPAPVPPGLSPVSGPNADEGLLASTGLHRSDSRTRVAWGDGLGGDMPPSPGSGALGAVPAFSLSESPRHGTSGRSTPVRLPPIKPSTPQKRMSAAHLGPGNADAVAWSDDAAALADVVHAVQRELGGVNELYSGMHLAGPEGSTSADLAALAAVCPRSGACVTAVVSARRLRDPLVLYDAALAARRSALGPAHPMVVELQLQYARHLSAAGHHAEAEAACRAALAQLAAAAAARRHPVEVSALQTLGSVLRAAGSLAPATSALVLASELAEELVAAGELAAADARRVAALDALSEVLFLRADADAGGGAASTAPPAAQVALGSAAPLPSRPLSAAGLQYIARAVEAKCQSLDLTASVVGQRHERVMRGWAELGAMAEAAGDLRGAERAFVAAAEIALHLYGRRAAATRDMFRKLQRVYRAQGRTADAEILGHMYRLNGGRLAATSAQQLM